MEEIETLVVGAGVIGLACARKLAMEGHQVIVLEQESRIAEHTSSRNSEVIHAGIYYAPGSLKARLCVEGRNRLYEFCDQRGIEYRRYGKLIVATSERQVPTLEKIQATAQQNGVDLSFISGAESAELEPAVRCSLALLSPSTGVINSHEYMLALQADAESCGAVVATRAHFGGASLREDGAYEVRIGGAESFELRARNIINAAGLLAWDVAASIEGFPASRIPPRHLAKGSYFSLRGRSPFKHLVYPVPEDGGLGVHVTLDLGGSARFGPDVEWTDRIDYRTDPARAERFYGAIRQYWPALPDHSLMPAYSGVRPKVSGPGQPAQDFVVQGPSEHGLAGLVNLFGIESPGLTASLPLADLAATSLQ